MVGGYSFDEGIRIRPHVAVQKNLARLIHDAEVNGACLQVDAAVVLVLLSVESRDRLLLCRTIGITH